MIPTTRVWLMDKDGAPVTNFGTYDNFKCPAVIVWHKRYFRQVHRESNQYFEASVWVVLENHV